MSLMALEIVSSRLLAPQFGSSVYVWGSIISVFLAVLSVGYAWGGRLADRWTSLPHLGFLLLLSTACQLGVIFFGTEVVTYFGELTGGSPSGTLLVTTLLFGPATLFLATVSPFAVRLAASDLQGLGGVAGHLYAISTAGSLFGTLGATYVLVPYLGLDGILRLLASLTLLAACLALGSPLPSSSDAGPRGRRWAWIGAVVLGLALLVPRADRVPDEGPKVLDQRMTPYQTLLAVDAGEVVMLYSDNTLHGAQYERDGRPALAYAQHAAAGLLLAPEMRNALFLGMGAGSVGSYLQRQKPDLRVEYVEIDPAVPEMARAYFDLPFGDEDVHIDDGRRFLARSEGRTWDYIYVDTYFGQSVPFHMTTREFFEQVRARLAPGGVLGINLLARLDSPLPRSIVRTLDSVFAQVHVLDVSVGSALLVLATDDPARFDPEAKAELGRRLDQETSFRPSLERLAGTYLPGPHPLADGLILTDAYAPVNHLLTLDANPVSKQSLEEEALRGGRIDQDPNPEETRE